MPNFTYKAIDTGGQIQTGELEVDGEAAAIARIEEMGLCLVSLSGGQQKAKHRDAGTLKVTRTKAKLDELAMVSRQLAIMIDSGVPIVEALQSLAAQIRTPSLRDVISDVQQQVLQGYSLSQSLARHSGVFSQLYIDMVKTAEAGGELGRVMDQLATYLEGNLDIIRKVKSAMMYPIIVIAASVVTVVALETFVLPRFMKLFKQMGVAIPVTTKMLLAISNFLINYWYAVILGLAATGFLLKLVANSASGRRWLDWGKLHAPVVGDLFRKIVLSRSLLALGTLLNGGVPLVTALETAAEASGNQVVGSVYRSTRSNVEGGGSIADAFGSSAEFPALVVQMTAVGERTGELPDLLLRVSDFYSKETDAKIKGLTSVVEPVLIVVLGALVGFIAVSIISPIYSLVGGVQ